MKNRILRQTLAQKLYSGFNTQMIFLVNVSRLKTISFPFIFKHKWAEK